MTTKACLAFIVLCAMSSLTLYSQQSRIQGILLDSDATPIPYTTISLLTVDSVFAGGAISEEDGSYKIEDLTGGQYILIAQNIEFATYSSEAFDLAPGDRKTMDITMEKASIEMDEVVVKGKRALIEVKPDKMIFNVASSVNTSGNNGLELLSKAPGVVVDPDNNIILQGKSGVRIFINGRPTRLSGTDLVTMLQTMQSDNILAIEIITNPSVRFEAEGNAGIINFKLKNNVTLGYNGSWISNYSLGSHPRMNHGLTFNYGREKLSFNVNVTRFDDVFQEDFVDIKYQNDFIVDLGSYEVKGRSGFNLSAGLDYQISDNHTIGLTARGVLTDGDYELNSTTQVFNNQEVPVESLEAQTLTTYQSNNYNFSLNYQWNVSEEATFSTDFSYGSFLNDRRIDQPNNYFDPDGTLREEVDNAFEPYTIIDLYSAKADYEQSWGGFTLATGVKYAHINTSNDFTVFDVINDQDVKNTDASNDFTYLEKVAAGYITTSTKLSDRWTLNAGLRLEHTQSEGRLISEQMTNNDEVIREYTDYFPNVSLSYNDGKRHEWNIGIGRRITRPNYQDLNPFEQKLSELALFKGNPFLNPNYITNYQISYVLDQKLVISNTFSVTEAFFAKIVSINGAKGTIVIPRNMDRAINNGLSISYPQEITSWWDVSGFLVYNYSLFQGEFDLTKIDFSQNIYNARIQNNLSLPWDITMDLTWYWSSPFVWRGTVIIDDYWGLNFGIKKNFFNDRLQVRLTGSDIFNTNSDYGYYGNYGGLEFDGVYSNDNHRFGGGLTWKFGNNRIKKKGNRSGLDDELRRISG
jgi:hypothetical protein